MKIGVVGSGLVGASAAYAMVMRGVGREIVLIDKNEKRAQAEAEALLHAVPFAEPLTVREHHRTERRCDKQGAGELERPQIPHEDQLGERLDVLVAAARCGAAAVVGGAREHRERRVSDTRDQQHPEAADFDSDGLPQSRRPQSRKFDDYDQ